MFHITRYREVEVAGTPREMGQQIGEAAREEIRAFSEVALDRVNITVQCSREKALGVARNCFPYVETYAPHLLDEMRGMAEGSGIPVDDLMLLQVRNQLLGEHDCGCTSFAVSPPAARVVMVGQNWDNDPALDPYTIVLTRRPAGKPALMNITQAGLIGYIGLNAAGIGLCMNTLPAPSRVRGVPHYFTVRGIFDSNNLDDAVHAVRRAYRAIPINIMLSTPQGPANLEVTLDNVYVFRDNGQGIVTHTNHCEHPDLQPLNAQFSELIQSIPRKMRIEKLLEERKRPLALENFKNALSDHNNYPTSICRHPNDHPTTGHWATTFSILIEPDAGLLRISRGNPCEHPYETYQMS